MLYESTRVKSLVLPLRGGKSVAAFMGANSGFVFAGTSRSPQAVRVEKGNWQLTQLGGDLPPLNISVDREN